MATPYNQSPYVGNRPLAKKDAQSNVIIPSFSDMTYELDYVGGTNAIYIGEARPGSSLASAVWQIKKIAYDANNNITSIKWPENTLGAASNDYQFIWNSRAGYTYI